MGPRDALFWGTPTRLLSLVHPAAFLSNTCDLNHCAIGGERAFSRYGSKSGKLCECREQAR